MDKPGEFNLANRRRKDDPGHIITLLLKDELMERLRQLDRHSDDSAWSEIADQLASALTISPIDVVIWELMEDCNALEISLPAHAECLIDKWLVPTPCESLQRFGILAADFGVENRMAEAIADLSLQFKDRESELVCIHLSDRSMRRFLADKTGRLARIASIMEPPRQSSAFERYQLLRIAPYLHGIRLLMMVEREAHKRLCTAIADNHRAVANTGILRVTVRAVMMVSLGMNDVKKDADVKKSRDPDKPMPTPDKPDQEHETWLSWVHLKRRRGVHRGPSIYLVRGKDKCKAAWHYVHVNDSLLSEFLEKTRGGSLDVADYGEVLASGWGEDPPQDLADSIDRDYA